MIVSVVLLGLIVGQSVLCGNSDHCETKHKKVNARDMVRSINKTPKITWKATTYKLKEVDLNLIARTKLGVKMEDMRMTTATEMQRLETQSKKPLGGNITELPENFTWAESNHIKCPISTIRDQSNCGSCWAVAPASILSDRFCLQSNGTLKTPLSHQKLLTCITKNYGCSGGYMNYLFDYLKMNGTITGGEYDSDEGCQQYTIRPCGAFASKFPCSYPEAITPRCLNTKCNNDWYKYKTEKTQYKMLESKWVPAYFSDDQARQQIFDNGPILAMFWVYPDFMFYQKGIYIHKVGWWPLGGHAVRVVGWGVENNIKFWHVANSWGADWGEKGFFRIRRGTNECSFDWNLYALVPDYNNTSSKTISGN